METKIWVNITFNAYDQLVGKDEFLTALKRDGIVVQEREKWQPAACTGQEIDIILVLINNPIVQYLAKVAMDGMVYGLMMRYIPKLFEALGQLKEQNQDFSVECLQFEFDDITIKIKDLRDVDYAYLQDTFFNMGEHIESLNQMGIVNIREISLPYVKRDEDYEDNGEIYITSGDFAKEMDYFWKIIHADGCTICYYNPKEKTVNSLTRKTLSH